MGLSGESCLPGGETHSGAIPLELSGVCVFAGDPARPILRNIDLTVAPGEWVTVTGANGSGKSTLIGVIAGLIEPDEGSVRRGFAGNGPIPWVMQQVGPFFGDTPWEEVLFSLEEGGGHADDLALRAEEVLVATGLHPLRHRPVTALSGGRRQLVSVAACLAAGAPLLLFDEAAAMLDIRSRRLVLETAIRLHRNGAAVLWSTHRLGETVTGGRIVVLQDGEIAFDGPAEHFFYRTGSDGRTPCESFGFSPPFAVRTARALMRRGWVTESHPLDAEQLAAALRQEAVVRGR